MNKAVDRKQRGGRKDVGRKKGENMEKAESKREPGVNQAVDRKQGGCREDVGRKQEGSKEESGKKGGRKQGGPTIVDEYTSVL